jgi:excisionase family DNA binding protein
MKKISVTELAELEKCSRTNILKKIHRGTLKYKHYKVGNDWVIHYKL